MEQIITGHSRVTGGGELYSVRRYSAKIALGEVPATYKNCKIFRDRYLAEISLLATEGGFITDKMPNNFCYIGLILSALPEAKIVHVRRDPTATCWSNYKTNFRGYRLGYSNDFSDLVAYYSLYRDLMEYWYHQYNESIYFLDYDKLTVNQEDMTRDMIQKLGLDWDDNCLLAEKTNELFKRFRMCRCEKKCIKGVREVGVGLRVISMEGLIHSNIGL